MVDKLVKGYADKWHNWKKMMTDEKTEGLEEIYNYVYSCSKCKTKYGSDEPEKGVHLCPDCEKKTE